MGHARPPKTFKTGMVTVWLRRAAVALAAGLAVFLLVRYPALPETIPTHFSWTGAPDEWGPRWTVFPAIAVFMALVLGVAWLSFKPQILNNPFVITDANAQAAYRESERMLVWLALALLPLYAWVALALAGGGGGPTILFRLLLPIGLVGMLVTVLVGIARLIVVNRDRADAHGER